MRKVFILFFLIFCFSTACEPATYTVSAPVAPGPTLYVYTYPDGSCYENDVWYNVCPRYMGPIYGYYAWYGGGYVHRPGYVWPHRNHRHYAPPRSWHPPRPVHRHHR